MNGGVNGIPCFDSKGDTVREVVDPKPLLERNALDILDVRQRTQWLTQERRIRGFRYDR
jgi:hypothetical protein